MKENIMKNKLTATILIIAMLFCLCIGISGSAYADNSTTVTVGAEVNWAFDNSSVGNIATIAVSSGSLPDGLSLTYSGTTASLTGTPTKAGTFTASIQVTTDTAAAYITSITVTVNEAKPAITKHPTGETVDEGGSAMFIARADNCTSFVWRIVSADTTNTIIAKDAPSYFKGLTVEGADSDTLVLSNIPASMDGWAVECKFTGNDGSLLFTNGAVIHVNAAVPAPPKITVNPSDAEAVIGEAVTLSVSATADQGCTLDYQWYSGSSKDNLSPVAGANKSSFTVPQTEGTVYYCAYVNSVGRSVKSEAHSSVVAVTYSAAVETPQPTEAPAAQPSAAPVTSAPEGSGDVSGDSTGSESDSKSGSSSSTPWFIFVLIGAGVIVVCLIAAIIVAHKDKEEDDEAIFRCPSCGWEPGPNEDVPYFCPDCGEPFDEKKWEK